MRVPSVAYVTLGIGLVLGAGVPGAALSQVPSVEPQTRVAVPARGAVIQTAAPTEASAPATQTPGQPTTAPSATAPAEPPPVTVLTPSGGATPIGGSAGTPQPTASSAQAATASSRSFAAAKFGLTLAGGQVGWLNSAQGGTPTGQVVKEKVGPDHIALKHLGNVVYEPITVITDFQSKELMDWVAASWKGAPRKNGSILQADYDYTVQGEQEFFNALVVETTLPALDVASKDAARITVKLAPEYTRMKAGSGSKASATKAAQALKKWLPADFKFEMTGLDGSKVNKIDEITVRQTVSDHAVGEMRDYEKEPGAIEFPNLKITLAATTGQTWQNWLEDFVVKGNNGADQERSGAIVYFDTSRKNELGRVKLSSCGIFRLSPEPVAAGSESVRRLVAEMYCEGMELVPAP